MNTPRRQYRTDLSDARWALIEPMLLAWRAKRTGLGIAKIQHDLREIVNAILYVNRTGIAWEYLPHDFPPYKTVHGYFALWEKEGITEAIHDALRGKVRRATGRPEEPTAAILDAQTVKTSGNVPEHSQGIDAGKKIKGRKRHVATDVLGLLLVVLVSAASVQDTAGGRVVVEQVARQHPTVAVARGGLRIQAERHRGGRAARYRRAGRHQGSAAAGVQAATQALGGRKNVRVADVAPPVGSRLRNQPTTVPGDDSLGDDRQHVPALDG
jgi:transposase